MEYIKYIIICWILSFLIYGLIRLWTRKHNEKNKGESRKSIEKGPSKTKEKINAQETVQMSEKIGQKSYNKKQEQT